MKLGVFTDPHYALADRVTGTRRPRLSMSKLREAELKSGSPTRP